MENQRILITKKMLENALIELLKTKSIYDISIRELCDVANINRSTFYKHYSSQFDLLNSMEDSLLKEVNEYMLGINKTQDSLTKNLVYLLRFLKGNKEFAKLLLNNNVDPKFPARFFALPGVNNAIQNSIDGEIIEPYKSYFISFLISGSFSVIRKWLNDNCSTSEKNVAELLGSIQLAFKK